MRARIPTMRRPLRFRFLRGIRIALGMCLALAPAIFASGQDCLEMADRWPYGVTRAVAADGATAMVNSGAAIQFVDLTAPRTPVVYAEVVIDHEPLGLALNQDLAVIVDNEDYLHVVDLHSASGPEIVGKIRVVSNEDLAVDLAGSIAYVAAGAWGLRVIDLSDPINPVEIGFVDPPGEEVVGVSVSGSLVVVAAKEDGLWIVDVSDPSNPSRVSVFPLYVRRVEAHGSFAFLGGEGLRIVDLSVPTSPEQIGFFDPEYSFSTFTLSPSGKHVYLVGDFRLKVVDVGDPADPIEVGETTTAVYSYALAATEGLVVSIYPDSDFQVFSAEVPASPYLIGWVVLRSHFKSEVTVYGDRVYMVEGQSFRILDATDPRNLRQLGVLYEVTLTQGVAVYQGHAYVGALGGFWVVDVSDPERPSATSFFSLPVLFSPEKLIVAHDHLYVKEYATGDPDVLVFDVSNPNQPTEVGSLDLPGPMSSFVISGNHAYSLSSSIDVVSIVDISTPWDPFRVSSFIAPGNAYRLAADGDHLVLVNNSQGINVYDVSKPESPMEVGSLDDIGAHSFFAVAGDRIFVSAMFWGTDPYSAIETIDISDPTDPVLIHSVSSPDPLGITVDGSRVFVANGNIGMTVYVECTLFFDGFESGDTTAWSEVEQFGCGP